MFASFDTPFEVTTSELAIEFLFPADRSTAEALRGQGGDRRVTRGPGPGQLIAGVGGLLLIVSLFLPWAGADGADRTGFEVLKGLDVFLLIAGLVAIAAALTGGRYGVFRPDLSLNGAADLLGLVSTVVLVWLILFDFPPTAVAGSASSSPWSRRSRSPVGWVTTTRCAARPCSPVSIAPRWVPIQYLTRKRRWVTPSPSTTRVGSSSM